MNEIESWATANDSERVDMVKSVWEQGDSMRSIASKLSSIIGVEVTRNAVAGVFSRNKATLVAYGLGAVPIRLKTGHVGKKDPEPAIPSAPEPDPVVSKPAAPDLGAATPDQDAEQEPLFLNLVELTNTACKWPVGDWPHKFCGVNSGSTPRPYCGYHTKLAYVPAKERSAKPFVPRRKLIGAR